MMRTRLARFSEEFDAIVRPVLEPLQQASQAFEVALTSAKADDAEAESDGDRAGPGFDRELVPDLHELHHQLSMLVDKVAEQQAFILIFGPLKSGKSTLMNALSAEYVSEVTSLPAYPCMVYVAHSPTKSYRLTRYDGKVEEIHDAGRLRLHVQRAHSELAARIREVEEEGKTFDPAAHLPSAIRRIDVRVPAGELEQSGAVLVDTPGLYTRMKFGYDRMTKEFRNAAACAMFVVKTDNLFLEQVFEEFNELLELFSRIFLVVNVDTTKSDLSPNGELVPSLEQSDPLRLIEAFENLSMSAPLKQAADEGRLRIYPVDLLRAASWRLKQGQTATGGDEEAFQGQASFDTFLGDLTQFLNSTDYLNAFLHDSLRRARMLLSDASEICERASIKDFLGGLAELERRREEARVRHQALQRLEEFAWDGALTGVKKRLVEQFLQRARDAEARTTAALDAAVDAWFETDTSLEALLQDELVPVLARHHSELSSYARDVLAREALDETGGLYVTSEIKADLTLNEISLERLAREAVRTVGTGTNDAANPRPSVPFGTEDIPVKKKVWDWVLLRRMGSVRKRLFGPADQPSHRIPVHEKAALLGDAARRAMQRRLDIACPPFFRDAADAVPASVLATYEESFRAPLSKELATRRKTLDDQLATLDREIEELTRIKERITGLERAASSGLIDISALTARHVEAGDVLQPSPRPEGVLPKTSNIDDLTAESATESSTAFSDVAEPSGTE